MEKTTLQILKENKEAILSSWIAKQQDENNYFNAEDQATDSQELVDALVNSLNDTTLEDKDAQGFDKVNEILMGISVSRAKRGFSPRETGIFLFSFKEALLEVLSQNISERLFCTRIA
jgi:rsbT co-antagonist protein RsbR